jgi:hypothetical protein
MGNFESSSGSPEELVEKVGVASFCVQLPAI